MSPRAAWRLERMGFEVYDYTLGKVDWMAAGLPTIRTNPAPARAIDAVVQDVATCRPDDLVRDVPMVVHGCVVTNDAGIVLGRIRANNAAHGADVTAEAVMQPGPATVRAHEPLGKLRSRMAARGVTEMLVTNPEGRLLGIVRQ